MGGWLDAQVAIRFEASPPCTAPRVITIDDFRDSARSRENIGYFGGKIDDDVDVVRWCRSGTEQYRGLVARGARSQHLVRHETAIHERPQQIVERSELVRVGVPDKRGLSGKIGLLGQSTGDFQPRGGRGFLEDVKVDAQRLGCFIS